MLLLLVRALSSSFMSLHLGETSAGLPFLYLSPPLSLYRFLSKAVKDSILRLPKGSFPFFPPPAFSFSVVSERVNIDLHPPPFHSLQIHVLEDKPFHKLSIFSSLSSSSTDSIFYHNCSKPLFCLGPPYSDFFFFYLEEDGECTIPLFTFPRSQAPTPS